MRTFFIRPMIFLLAFISIAAVSFGDPLTDAKNAAAGIENTVSASYGSQAGIQQNISNPLTSSNTLMTTLDKSESFNAQLSCPSSSAFLSVLVQPASTGDLQTVIASEDLNMDGKPDYSYQLPVPVSGVCANGFISCDPGTWNNCQAYKWAVDGSLHVFATAVNLTDLGGCYCINTSCGSSLVWNNMAIVLKDLGGGIAGALQKTDPQLSVSNVSTSDTVISYYGQKAGGCQSAGGGTGSASPEQYFSNPYAMKSDAQNLAQSESSDPNSYYSELEDAQNMSTGNVQLQQCTISRVLQCLGSNPGYANYVDDGCRSLEANSNCQLKDETVDGVQTWLNFASTGLTPLAPACDSFTLQNIAACPGFTGAVSFSGAHYLIFVGSGNQINVEFLWDTCWCVRGIQTIYLPAGITASGSAEVSFYQDGRSQTVKIVGIGSSLNFYDGGGNFNGQINLTGATISGTAYFNSSGSCAPFTISGQGDKIFFTSCGTYSLSIPSTCPLGSQYACVSRASSGVLSGASVSGTSYTCPIDTSNGGDPICFTPPATYTLCPDFLEKDRTYYCAGNAPFDFSAIQKRAGNVLSTEADNGGSFYYQDLRQNSSGGWVYNGVTSGLPPRDTPSDCEQACKTEKIVTDTQAALLGSNLPSNASQYQANNTQNIQYFYKTCVNGKCPSGPGETIVEDCQCIDDFGEAAGIMQSLRMAGSDLICSDGTAEPLQ